MGILECDDGNLIDGDGCDSYCRIEEGYECHRENGGTDVCRDVIAPEVMITVLKENKIRLEFSEIVFTEYSSICSFIS